MEGTGRMRVWKRRMMVVGDRKERVGKELCVANAKTEANFLLLGNHCIAKCNIIHHTPSQHT